MIEPTKKEWKVLGVCVELKRPAMIWDLAVLINDGAVNLGALEEFSEDLKQTIKFI